MSANESENWMRTALEAARKGWGRCVPNPMVGAVIVRDGVMLASGYHQRAGEGHAEVNALANLPAGTNARGATVYVTLEPCSTYGRTPPCCDALIKAGGVSVIHPDILTCGGALELKKIADIADENGVATVVHMAESPVACMAAVQTAAAMHNVLALEFHSVDVPWWADMVTGIDNPIFKNGFIKVPEKPGLGFDDLNEEVLREHINPNIPGYFEPTDEWNKEFSNDRIWS